MIELNIIELFKRKDKSKYWLYKQLGISYQNFNIMISNQTKPIRFENIENLCIVLECTPNDLFLINFDKRECN